MLRRRAVLLSDRYWAEAIPRIEIYLWLVQVGAAGWGWWVLGVGAVVFRLAGWPVRELSRQAGRHGGKCLSAPLAHTNKHTVYNVDCQTPSVPPPAAGGVAAGPAVGAGVESVPARRRPGALCAAGARSAGPRGHYIRQFYDLNNPTTDRLYTNFLPVIDLT